MFGFSQKHLHNGFVAATSSGVYYLQDGDDQWLKFNGFNPEHYDSRFKRNHIDTITGISFFKDNYI